jgi:molecular chaperone GrpE
MSSHEVKHNSCDNCHKLYEPCSGGARNEKAGDNGYASGKSYCCECLEKLQLAVCAGCFGVLDKGKVDEHGFCARCYWRRFDAVKHVEAVLDMDALKDEAEKKYRNHRLKMFRPIASNLELVQNKFQLKEGYLSSNVSGVYIELRSYGPSPIIRIGYGSEELETNCYYTWMDNKYTTYEHWEDALACFLNVAARYMERKPDPTKGRCKPEEQDGKLPKEAQVEAAEKETKIEDRKYEALEKELEQARQEAIKNLERWQRERDEFSMYKRRVEREQVQMAQDVKMEFINKYLIIADDLERALKACPQEGEGEAWAQGIELIYRKVQKILEIEKVVRIPAEGEFDPTIHEAISSEDSQDHKSGEIIEVIRQGYKIGERIIRPAQVRVAR